LAASGTSVSVIAESRRCLTHSTRPSPVILVHARETHILQQLPQPFKMGDIVIIHFGGEVPSASRGAFASRYGVPNPSGDKASHVVFLRGVSPLNAKSTDLKRSFEAAGFTNVKTILSSGNVTFDTSLKSESAIEQRAEVVLQESLGRTFYTIVRPSAYLNELLAQDPYANYISTPRETCGQLSSGYLRIEGSFAACFQWRLCPRNDRPRDIHHLYAKSQRSRVYATH
jgi:hypothetical protein